MPESNNSQHRNAASALASTGKYLGGITGLVSAIINTPAVYNAVYDTVDAGVVGMVIGAGVVAASAAAQTATGAAIVAGTGYVAGKAIDAVGSACTGLFGGHRNAPSAMSDEDLELGQVRVHVASPAAP